MGVRLTAGILAALGSVALLAAPANAKLKYVSNTVAVGPNAQSPVATATCGNRHVLSGGAFISTGFAVVNFSAPDDSGLDADDRPDDAWQVSMTNLTGIDASVSVYAICDDRMPKYRDFEPSVTGELSTTQSCPQGARITGAGVVTVSSGTQTYIRTWAPYSFFGNKAGAMSAVVKGSGVASPVFLTAVCSEDLALKYVKKELTIPASDAKQKFVQCPPKTKVVGGGDSQGTVGSGWELETTISVPSDGNDAGTKPDDAWRISVRNPVGESRMIPVVAVCAKV